MTKTTERLTHARVEASSEKSHLLAYHLDTQQKKLVSLSLGR